MGLVIVIGQVAGLKLFQAGSGGLDGEAFRVFNKDDATEILNQFTAIAFIDGGFAEKDAFDRLTKIVRLKL